MSDNDLPLDDYEALRLLLDVAKACDLAAMPFPRERIEEATRLYERHLASLLKVRDEDKRQRREQVDMVNRLATALGLPAIAYFLPNDRHPDSKRPWLRYDQVKVGMRITAFDRLQIDRRVYEVKSDPNGFHLDVKGMKSYLRDWLYEPLGTYPGLLIATPADEIMSQALER